MVAGLPCVRAATTDEEKLALLAQALELIETHAECEIENQLPELTPEEIRAQEEHDEAIERSDGVLARRTINAKPRD
jgi:hypothetical protein